jgi:hypothetical protein
LKREFVGYSDFEVDSEAMVKSETVKRNPRALDYSRTDSKKRKTSKASKAGTLAH